jgi:hypothetical protein
VNVRIRGDKSTANQGIPVPLEAFLASLERLAKERSLSHDLNIN